MKEIIDGKINDIEYDNASCKILWILKEANISAEDKEKEIDVCEGFRNDWHKKKCVICTYISKNDIRNLWYFKSNC